MNLKAKQLHDEITSGSRMSLIDVRTPVEYEEMHITGSRLMPLDQLDVHTFKTSFASDDHFVLICRSGKRAEQAFKKLSDAGFKNLSVLEGGVTAWDAAGLPMQRGSAKRLPLMRQVQLIIGLLALGGSVLALTVHKNYAIIPAFLGAGLTMAGATGWCGLAILLSKMPWNKVAADSGKSCAI